MSDRDKQLDRVRKLLEHANSATEIGSQAEAETFAATAHRLMADYAISQGDIDAAEVEDWESYIPAKAMGFESIPGWCVSLCASVAEAHFCRLVATKGSTAIGFIGRPVQRAVAIEVARGLVNAALRMADSASAPSAFAFLFDRNLSAASIDHATADRERYAGSFLKGFADGVRTRMIEAKRATLATEVECTALVRLSDEANERVDHLDARDPREGGIIEDANAYVQGYYAGDAQDLGPTERNQIDGG